MQASPGETTIRTSPAVGSRTIRPGLATSLLLLAALFGACARPAPPPATLAITNVTLIDAGRDLVQEDMTVLVNGDRISAIGRSSRLRAPEQVPTVNGEDLFLIPGLWDMHVHLANEEEPAIPAEHLLPLFLAHGVVGVRDMGSDWQAIESLRQRSAAGSITGPEILSPGPFVDGSQPAGPAVMPAANAEEARAAVRLLAEWGVDFVKVQAKLSREAYAAALDEAAELELPVYGHIPDAMTAIEVSQAGQGTIEHVSPALPSDGALLFSCSAKESELRRELADIATARSAPDADRQSIAERTRALQRELIVSYDTDKATEVFATLRRNRTSVVPTLTWSRLFSPPESDLPEDLPIAVMPTPTRDRWQAIWEGYFARVTEDVLGLNRQIAQGSLDLVASLHQNGVSVLAGTDAPFGFVLPGFSLHQELELLVQAGLTPTEALTAATSKAAAAVGQLEERGTLEPGKRADLVLLSANPLANIENTRRIEAVVAGGRLHDRAHLDRLIEAVVEAGRADPVS